ncbi:MAG: mechanosensitive ion channel protein MscS [Rhodobacterales bacterium]|nr:MAG: mechanosensitive ion channel protein MscS [Rhodobacterales bacterium]
MLHLLRGLTLLLALSAPPALAQGTPPAPTDAAAPPTGAKAASDASEAANDIDALISILENDSARTALIERLRNNAVTAPEAPKPPAPPAAPEAASGEPVKPTFSRSIAHATQEFVEETAAKARRIGRQLGYLPYRISRLDGKELEVLWDMLKNLAVIIAVTVGVYIVLRRFSKHIYRRMNLKAQEAGIVKRFGLWLSAGAIDMVTVIATWAVGYGVAVTAVGDAGQIGIRQTMYLNAFLMVGLFKVAARLFIAPSAPQLRALPIRSSQAQFLARRIAWIAGILGYGQMLVVPVINANVSYSSGQLTSTAISIGVLAYLIWISIRNRAAVARWLSREAAPPVVVPAAPDGDALERPGEEPAETAPPRRGALARLASYWYIPVSLYLAVMMFMVVIQPPSVVMKSFVSSGQMLLVVMFGITLSNFLTHVTESGFPVPPAIAARVPLLQARLNSFLPMFLGGIRYAIMIVAGLLVLDAISLIDLPRLVVSPLGLQLLTMASAVMFILFVSFLVWLAMNSWVDYRLNPSVGKVASSRELTLLTLFRNAATIALLVLTLMVVLSEIGIDIAPLLASAGVLGLAIGFGAQKMVQDIITGIFIQVENAMNVGDFVTVGNITGKVEKLTIRSVSIRDKEGAFHIMPFSSVDMVTSYAREFGYYLCDMGVGYSEDANTVKEAMFDAFRELVSDRGNRKKVKGDLEWHGLQTFGDSAVVFRVKIKTTPGDQWSIGRAYNVILKRIFDERGIEIPFPHQTIYFGDANDKDSGPARLVGESKS